MIVNPEIGWIQNCNSTPFTSAAENSPKIEDYPIYMSRNQENYRGVHAIRLLENASDLTLDKLIDMGAKIILCDPHRATVIGHDFRSQLKATTMVSPDIRAGISLLIAALSAKGTSVIHNIEQIDRGYERIDERLRAIGAKIERIE